MTGKIFKYMKHMALVIAAALLAGGMPVQAEYTEPGITAEAGILMELQTGSILYEKNIHEKLYPASITKMMTALVTIEHADLQEEVTFSHNSVYDIEPGSSILGGVEEGDVLTVEECLYALMLTSGNEIAYALAEHVGGDLASFAEMMNEKAAALGCEDTHFTNPHGLHDEEHYTSAYDMALISQAVYQNETLREITGTVRHEFPPTRDGEQRIRVNHHKMMEGRKYAYDGCAGGKTGYTTQAGSTLVTYAVRDGLELVCVVMKGTAQTYWDDTRNLLDFGFANFYIQKLAELPQVTEFLASREPVTAGDETAILGRTLANPDAVVVLPKDVDAGSVSCSPVITDGQLELEVLCQEQSYGKALINEQREEKAADSADAAPKSQNEAKKQGSIGKILKTVLLVLLILALLGGGGYLGYQKFRKQDKWSEYRERNKRGGRYRSRRAFRR